MATQTPRIKVLLVDDSPERTAILRTALEKARYRVAAVLEDAALQDIPVLGARAVKRADGDIAVFRNAEDEVFALREKCPHKGGPLSQGIVHGRHVTCPLHGWNVALFDGEAVAPDRGEAPINSVKIEDGIAYLQIQGPMLCSQT